MTFTAKIKLSCWQVFDITDVLCRLLKICSVHRMGSIRKLIQVEKGIQDFLFFTTEVLYLLDQAKKFKFCSHLKMSGVGVDASVSWF